jgi:hypothetical protein
MLKVIDTRRSDAPAQLHKHPRLPFAVCRGPDEAHLTQIGLHETRHEAESAMMSIVRRPYVAAMVGAIALASAPASAATVSIQYSQLSQNDIGDLQAGSPQLASALGPNGLPVAVLGSGGMITSSDLGAANQIEWWSNGYAFPGPTPTPNVVNTASSIDVNAFPWTANGYQNGWYGVEVTANFTAATSGVEELSVSSNGFDALYLNGQLVDESGGNQTIAETIKAGANVLTAFYIDEGQAPFFSFDPSLPQASAAATPEASTFAMLMAGFAGLGWLAYRKRHTPRLASAFAD